MKAICRTRESLFASLYGVGHALLNYLLILSGPNVFTHEHLQGSYRSRLTLDATRSTIVSH